MGKKNQEEEYLVGYKKPPRHTRFQPGQSGNPTGRPKKVPVLADIFLKELQTRLHVVSNGKSRRVSMLEVIVKQHLKKAANGDSKAAALIFKQLRENALGTGDKLSDLVQEFRAVYARQVADDCELPPAKDAEVDDGE